LFGLYLFIYIWSVPMLMLDLVPVWGQSMGGFLLILQGTIVMLWLVEQAALRGLLAALAIGGLAYLVECAGVTLGIPFGRYHYTAVLGQRLGGAVPLAIPFAWLMVVPGAWASVAPLGRPPRIIFLAALLAILLDLLIEPVAAHIAGYWRWTDGGPYYGVPTINFIAWGGTALILLLVLWIAVPEIAESTRQIRLPALLFTLNVVQFTLVDAAYGFWWAASIGIVLLSLNVTTFLFLRRSMHVRSMRAD
jgi:putative membrane protein